jgi:hypothetical protein
VRVTGLIRPAGFVALALICVPTGAGQVTPDLGAGVEYAALVNPAGAARQRDAKAAEHARIEFANDGVRLAAEDARAASGTPVSVSLHLARLGR